MLITLFKIVKAYIRCHGHHLCEMPNPILALLEACSCITADSCKVGSIMQGTSIEFQDWHLVEVLLHSDHAVQLRAFKHPDIIIVRSWEQLCTIEQDLISQAPRNTCYDSEMIERPKQTPCHSASPSFSTSLFPRIYLRSFSLSQFNSEISYLLQNLANETLRHRAVPGNDTICSAWAGGKP